jgi:hypothetical protein
VAANVASVFLVILFSPVEPYRFLPNACRGSRVEDNLSAYEKIKKVHLRKSG